MEDNPNFDPKFLHLKGIKVQVMYEGNRRVGTLYFAGINTLLHGQYQVTLDRLPLWPVDPNTIKPYTSEI